MRKLIKLKHLESGEEWYYSSIQAALKDPANPVSITDRYWSMLVKEKGYPFEMNGCRIELHQMKGTKDV